MMFRQSPAFILAGIVIAAPFCARTPTLGAPFVNLNFEQSTVHPNDPQVVPAAAAFPGWTARIGSTVQGNVYHDYTGAGEGVVAVFDHDVTGQVFGLLQGQFMAYLRTDTSTLDRASLSQTGDVPADARSLTLPCDGEAGAPVLEVNGSAIPTMYLNGSISHGGTARWGADITSYAGTTVELRFLSNSFQSASVGRRTFDDVRFSATPLPEPRFLTISTLFAAVLFSRQRRRDEPEAMRKDGHHATQVRGYLSPSRGG